MRMLNRQDVTPRESAARQAPADGDATPSASLRVAAAVLSVAATVGLVFGVRAWVVSTPGFAVRRVAIEGAVHADPAALSVASGALGVNTFALDLDVVRQRLLAQSWVADAALRRVLPHELRVTVVERKPVAWATVGNRRALVDESGQAIGSDASLPVPEIVGLDALDAGGREAGLKRAAATLGALRERCPGLFHRVRAMEVARDGRLTLAGDGLPPVWMDGPDSTDEVAAWAERIETIRRAVGEAAYVDARWSGRLFVMPKGAS